MIPRTEILLETTAAAQSAKIWSRFWNLHMSSPLGYTRARHWATHELSTGLHMSSPLGYTRALHWAIHELATGLQPQSDEDSPTFTPRIFKVRLSIVLTFANVSEMVYSLQVLRLKPCACTHKCVRRTISHLPQYFYPLGRALGIVKDERGTTTRKGYESES